MTTAIAAHGSVTKKPFGTMPDGTTVDLYTLKSTSLEVSITNYGARVVAIRTPDRTGKVANVALGYDTLDDYLHDPSSYYGAVVGRYGNRLAKGQFTIDGHQYQVPQNDHGQSLHGGTHGFDKIVWAAKEIANGVELSLVSKDGDMGFPGTLTVHVKYTVAGDALHIDYSATTDKTTVINVTNHSYFNLAGEGSGLILGHEMQIEADAFTPVDAVLIPTGVLEPVKGTPFDFHKSTVIGDRIGNDDEQLKLGGGYDHNWVLNGPNGVMKTAARAYDPSTGRVLTVTTTEPGVQFYSGNFLTGAKPGHEGHLYPKRSGFCLETQHYPDSPNHPKFPSTELKPGQTMHSTTVFTFTTQGK
ncbi:aldose epimerase family protein [Granulicella sp. WH15]|uniref:aldose epimerase family protein n=1 Tax=Granulicella sp. WH15 TaxID=2602070 RepID=UPI002103F1E9|nr:aldose epimerase family protein [Granulicella sp. WH15]